MNQQQGKERWQEYGATENGQLFQMPRPSRYEKAQYYDGATQPPLTGSRSRRYGGHGNGQGGEWMQSNGAGHGLFTYLLTC